MRGLSEKQKGFLVALSLWKIDRLLKIPFRYRSGCHLELINIKQGERDVEIKVPMDEVMKNAAFRAKDDEAPIVTDIYWRHDDLYREGKDADDNSGSSDVNEDSSDDGEGEDS